MFRHIEGRGSLFERRIIPVKSLLQKSAQTFESRFNITFTHCYRWNKLCIDCCKKIECVVTVEIVATDFDASGSMIAGSAIFKLACLDKLIYHILREGISPQALTAFNIR